MGCTAETTSNNHPNEVSYDVMQKREQSMLMTFKNIMNHMHDGIIIKSANRQEIFMANETANTIMRVDEKHNQMQYLQLNTKRFTKIDLAEDKDLYEDEDVKTVHGTSRTKISLNNIVK